MGQDSAISWTHDTFNPWWGCTRIGGSPACGPAEGEDGDRCYAEDWSERCGYKEGGAHFPIWGQGAQRRFFAPKHFDDLVKFNRIAEASGERRRVFIMSMGDWAEGRPDQRESLDLMWDRFDRTPMLDKLMLTKRPQLINTIMPALFRPRGDVWQGTTTETRFWMLNRWEHLKRVEAAVYWFSIEPLFEDLGDLPADFLALGPRAWVIVGGQSGAKARPLNPDWARRLRDQCLEHGVRFHMKQMSGNTKRELEAIPEDLMIRQYPEARDA